MITKESAETLALPFLTNECPSSYYFLVEAPSSQNPIIINLAAKQGAHRKNSIIPIKALAHERKNKHFKEPEKPQEFFNADYHKYYKNKRLFIVMV